MTPEEILKVEKDIVLTLKTIYDPEIPVNIYDLGLIYEIDYTPDGAANIRMTLTAPNCPMNCGKVAGKQVKDGGCDRNKVISWRPTARWPNNSSRTSIGR